jgi:glutathione S-transferase
VSGELFNAGAAGGSFLRSWSSGLTSPSLLAAPKILRSSPASPFGRKVKVAAAILGLSHSFEIVVTDTLNPDDPIRKDNPLGKIPALVLTDGSVIYDSRIIIEYLDLYSGGRLIPADPVKRLSTLRLQALADGMAEAALLIVYEGRFRDADKQEPRWVAHQQGKIDRALDHLDGLHLATAAPSVGEIAVACALGYLDLRHEGRWRKTHPALAAWLDAFDKAVPAFGATKA